MLASCSAEFTHAMALNGKHASMLRGQQRVNQRYLKRNMSSVSFLCAFSAATQLSSR